MDIWTIIIMIVIFLLGIASGYLVREYRRHLVTYYKDAKGEVQEIWGDSKDQFKKGLDKAKKEYEETIDYLVEHRRDLMKKRDQLSNQLKDWNEWWKNHTDDGK